jgi:hypothetical protein
MRFGHPALCARNSKQATINFKLSHWVGIRPAPYSLREVVSRTAKTLRTGPSPSRTSITTRPSAWRYVKSLTAKPTVLSACFRARVALGSSSPASSLTMPLASWNQNGPLPLADPQSLRGAVVEPDNYEASLTLSSVRRPTEIGIGRHEKPDTNAGLTANIFQTSVMGTTDQHPPARSAHKDT